MTSSRPLLIDGMCRKGGAGRGYQLAGFDVIGVDKEDHADGYPGEFIQGDALKVIPELCERYKVAAVHTGPPCQANIAITAGNRARTGWTDEHVNLIPQTRVMLAGLRARYGMPTVIENGPSKHLRSDVVLCGEMFGLEVIRHRYFELDGILLLEQPGHPKHRGKVAGMRHGESFQGPYFAVYGDGGGKGTVAEWQRAMGIDWMTDRKDIAEAIPPAYTRHIGEQLARHLTMEAAA